MFNKSLHTATKLFSIGAVLCCGQLAYAAPKSFTMYDQSPHGSADKASVSKVGTGTYTVAITPTDSAHTSTTTLSASSRWDAVGKVEPTFDTGRKK